MSSFPSFLMQIPALPILELLFFIVCVVYAFCIMYHLTRFGIGPNPKLLSLIFFVGFCILFVSMFTLFNKIDLNTVVERFGSINIFDFRLMP